MGLESRCFLLEPVQVVLVSFQFAEPLERVSLKRVFLKHVFLRHCFCAFSLESSSLLHILLRWGSQLFFYAFLLRGLGRGRHLGRSLTGGFLQPLGDLDLRRDHVLGSGQSRLSSGRQLHRVDHPGKATLLLNRCLVIEWRDLRLLGRQWSGGAEQLLRHIVLRIYGFGPFQVGLALFPSTVGPNLPQDEASLEIVGLFVEDFLGDLRSLESLSAAPKSLCQRHLQVHAIRMLCKQLAQLGDRSREKIPSQVEPGKSPLRELETLGFAALDCPIEVPQLLGYHLVVGRQFEGPLEVPGGCLQLALPLGYLA